MKYDKTLMKEMADDLENYINILDKYVIIEGLSPDDYKEAKKKIKKVIKHLRNGDGDKVFDKERYRSYVNSRGWFNESLCLLQR